MLACLDWMWGYGEAISAQPGNTLWLDVHLPRQHDSRAEDEYGLDYQQQMFSRRLEVNIPAMTLPQEDHGQTYIALLIAVIEPPGSQIACARAKMRLLSPEA